MIFALSVQDFVDKIGAYVGFAAAIGLALFALLLFSQARELKRLREWGAQAHDRMGELERRLAAALELARRASSAQRTASATAHPAAQRGGATAAASPAPAGRPAVARTSSPTRLPLLPAAPARVAGAALGSATMFVPLPKHPPGAVPAGSPVLVATPAPAPAARPAAPVATPAPAEAAPSAPPVPPTPAPATAAAQGPAQPAAPAPATAPPTSAPPAPPPSATNGHSDTFPPVPPVRRPAPPARRPAGAPGRRPATRPGQRPVPAAPLRARGPATATPRGGGNGNSHLDDSPRGPRRLTFLLAGLGVVALVAVAFLLLSGGDESPSSTSAPSSGTPAQQTSASRQTPAAAAPAHDRITVAVLNGTPTQGLAQQVADRLAADGFVKGPVTNASDQQRTVTVVSYYAGHEAEAQEVAKTLNVPSDAVGPIDPDTEAACAQGATCTATVVVTVGPELQ